MRRATRFIFAAVAIAAAALAVGVVSAEAESGPRCADLDSATFNYDDNGNGTYTLSVQLLLAGGFTACRQITYTLTIDNVASGPIVLTSPGDTTFSTTFSDTDNQACISATTSSSGGHVFDRGPDSGCVPISASGVGGNVGMG